MFKVQLAVSEVTAYRLENAPLFLVATPIRTLPMGVQMGVFDKDAVLDPDSRNWKINYLQAELPVNSKLAVGDYSGNLEVRLCQDAPAVCAQPVDGSPYQVPYKIKVRGGNTQDALQPLAGATPWVTHQGNAARTGFVAANVDPARFSRRWVKTGVGAAHITAGNGRVYIASLPGIPNSSPLLTALSENDGAELWRYRENVAGSTARTGEAAIDGDRLWVSMDTRSGTWLKALDAATGQAQLSIGLDIPVGWAPVVTENGVLMPALNGDLMVSHSRLDAGRLWKATSSTSVLFRDTGYWAPGVANGRAAMFDGLTFWTVDTASGVVKTTLKVATLPTQGTPAPHAYQVAVMGPGNRMFVNDYDAFNLGTPDAGSTRMLAFDVEKGSLLWTKPYVSTNPVLVGDTVLTGSFHELHAVDAATGAVKWSWEAFFRTAVGQFDGPLIAVGGLAFIGVDGVTYAVDLQTHQAVWQYPVAGRLAVSENGVLYIGESVSPYRLVAINLQGGPAPARQAASARSPAVGPSLPRTPAGR